MPAGASAERALYFVAVDRRWVLTACALTSGSHSTGSARYPPEVLRACRPHGTILVSPGRRFTLAVTATRCGREM